MVDSPAATTQRLTWRQYARRIYAWASRAREFVLALAIGTLIVLGLAWAFGCSQQFGKAAESAFELVGLGYVFRGLLSTRDHFKLKPMRQRLRDFLASFPGRKVQTVSGSGHAIAVGSATVSAKGHVADVATSDHELLQIVQRRLRELEKSTRERFGAVDERFGRLAEELHSARRELADANRATDQKYEVAHTDGLDAAIIGAVFLLLALLCGAAAELLPGLWCEAGATASAGSQWSL